MATPLPLSEPPEHPWTGLITEARRVEGLRSNQDIAIWVSKRLDWRKLSQHDHVALLIGVINRERKIANRPSQRGTFVNEGTTESGMRLLAGGGMWAQTWALVGYKQTRELTIDDTNTLEVAYQTAAEQNHLRAKWFRALRALMELHHATTAGELEAKGIALPTVEAGE